MKRLLALLTALLLLLTLCGCESDFKNADEAAMGFIKAMLLRDEDAMSDFIHPDYRSSAIPDDEFYEALSTQFFEIGHPLDALDSVTKTYMEDSSIEGDVLKCGYVARVNELFYNVELIILENDNGYGVISVAMALNTDVDYYYHESEQ